MYKIFFLLCFAFLGNANASLEANIPQEKEKLAVIEIKPIEGGGVEIYQIGATDMYSISENPQKVQWENKVGYIYTDGELVYFQQIVHQVCDFHSNPLVCSDNVPRNFGERLHHDLKRFDKKMGEAIRSDFSGIFAGDPPSVPGQGLFPSNKRFCYENGSPLLGKAKRCP